MTSLLVIMFQIGAGSPLAVPTNPPEKTVSAPAPAAETMPGTRGGERDVVKCRIIPTTGSRFGQRVCTSDQEAMLTAQEAKKTLERMQGAKTLPTN